MKRKRKPKPKPVPRARVSKEAKEMLQSAGLAFAGSLLVQQLMQIGREIRAARKQRKKGADVNGGHSRRESNGIPIVLANRCPPRRTVH